MLAALEIERTMESITTISEFIQSRHLGDWASVAGLLVSVVGFAITIFNVLLSKSAAKRAEAAADQALESMKGIETIEALAKAISLLEEIYRLNRTGEWQVILDRHVTLRSMLTAAKSGNTLVAEEQVSKLQAALQHSASISHKIETSLEKGVAPIGIAQMNKVLADQMQKLDELLAESRNEVGG